MDVNLSELQEMVMDREAWRAAIHGVTKSRTWLSDWTDGFSSSHVWMWELDYKESWAEKNGCFWTVVLEKTLESPLDCKEIHPILPKGDQSWMFIARTDVDVETPIFGHLMWRTDSFEKTLMLGMIEGRRRRGWQKMRWLDGITALMDMSLVKLHGLVMDNLDGILACCCSWGCKESDMTERLNWTAAS